MQYEAIRDERRMAANTATRIGDAFLSLLSFGQSFLDVFLRKDVDDTAKGRITFNNGAVNKGIVVFSEDGTFAEGLTGHGGRICPDGSAELDSLTLRRFLEVPELRFNRVSVQVGNQWRAPGGGIIRSVSPAADATGTALLHLEAGEIGTVAVGDLCMGIFHSETAADNAEANSDDNHGNFRFAGFYTAYWEITAVEDYTDGETGQTFHNGKVSYRLRPVSANYPRQMHPTAAMHFVCYGNRTDTARQSSRYSTLTYERFLTGVSDWEFSSKQIRMQVGDLSAFSPVSSYVRLTGDRGQRGEDGLDGKDGKSWTLRGTAFGHVTNMASLPSPAPDGIFLVDTGAEGLPVAVRRMGGAWASITTNQGDAYILAGDVWMATETAWANLGRIQGEKGERGQAGANGRTSRIYQRLDEGQHYYDGTTITADGFCYLDFYAVPSDTAKSGWDVYRCFQSYVYQAAQHALPPADADHWRSVGVNADSAFFSFLIARDARIDFLQGNAIAIRKKHATAPYAGMGGDFPFWAGAAQPYPDGAGFNGSTYTFAVDETGNLFASSAYLTGTIHATSGSIGGFAIQDGGLTNADDARNGVTITPTSITAQSSRSEEGRVLFDTQSNIVGAISASSGKEIFWPVALQLTGRPNDSYPGTALDIVEGITRGHRPEPVLIDGSVQLVDTSDAYNVPHPLPQGSPTYSNGQRVYVRSGAVLVNIAAATVALPKNPQHGDCYLFLPCGPYNLTIDPGAHALTIDGTVFKNKTYTCAKRMVYLVFVGRGASPFGWVGKTLQ